MIGSFLLGASSTQIFNLIIFIVFNAFIKVLEGLWSLDPNIIFLEEELGERVGP